jgi:hypothetical protein
MKYGIIFWGNSSIGIKIFISQKKIVRIMASVKPTNSCRVLFKRVEILPLPCEYIFSVMNFIVDNQEHEQTNSDVHNVNTRKKHHLHRSILNFSYCQKCAGIEIFMNE